MVLFVSGVGELNGIAKDCLGDRIAAAKMLAMPKQIIQTHEEFSYFMTGIIP